ncbi:type VI secretion system amidase effector protein Tae4 [Snodgrassella alvi]|uniref:type VI secretion system amidase effector protein Tae4 n=1 Tax=Snodgrassella alvi TaxID=1196083 RepID=UPI001C0D6B5A|nr:type VI secretion system amidase effector protein Tae4 [Snodgrassella alvi]
MGKPRQVNRHQNINRPQLGIRPLFSKAWAASQKIYNRNDTEQERLDRVADTIGGRVAFNINNVDEKHKWKNTCAVRMSYILNYSGLKIQPAGENTVTGKDKNYYYFRVNNLIDFLELQWGKPEIIKYPTVIGKKGIILFQISGWSDATGHATLFDGSKCYDHCYFSENEPEKKYFTDQANFWELK